jgi:hypothetical protein
VEGERLLHASEVHTVKVLLYEILSQESFLILFLGMSHMGIIYYYFWYRGPGSSIGIVTDYGLDGPGLNPGGDEIFHPSRPALGLTQPPI